ncbi:MULTISPECIES: PAS domain S-box protein [Oscillatoriales]|nr:MULTISPECIES: PAS domain S-box protein [Oscillatoriales]
MDDKITVLLIDDQAIIGEAIRRMLAPEKDIVFHYCGDPTQAFKAAKECNPTVILQDLVMPDMDGLTVVRFLRSRDAITVNTPLIVLSSKEDPVIKAKAFELGANDYLVKLPDRVELIARVRYHSKAYMNLLKRQEAEEMLKAENLRQALYIQQVDKVSAAAVSVEQDKFQPESLSEVAERKDELGKLATVFTTMVQTVKAREKELAQARDQLEAILNAVPGSISWLDSGGVYLGVNRYMAQDLNLPQDAIIGKEVGFLKGTSQLAEFMRNFITSDETSASSIINVEVNEVKRYYLVAAQKYRQGGATVSVGIDVTDRMEAEEALRIAEENYRSIFENALEGIFQATAQGSFISLNPAMARIYGYDSGEEMMAAITDIGTQLYVDSERINDFFQEMEENGKVTDFEYRAYRKDGSIVWVEQDTRAVRDSNGNVLYYEGMIQDITQRKRQEEELKRQLQELRIEIDQQKRQQEVAAITQSDYFQEIQSEADSLNVDDFWN